MGRYKEFGMIRIQSSLNSTEIHNLKNVLESYGIACEVRGEFRRSAMGEIPITDSFVELWVIDDDQEEAARRILADAQTTPVGLWTCSSCGEAVEEQFDQCWNCQASRS